MFQDSMGNPVMKPEVSGGWPSSTNILQNQLFCGSQVRTKLACCYIASALETVSLNSQRISQYFKLFISWKTKHHSRSCMSCLLQKFKTKLSGWIKFYLHLCAGECWSTISATLSLSYVLLVQVPLSQPINDSFTVQSTHLSLCSLVNGVKFLTVKTTNAPSVSTVEYFLTFLS